MLGSFWTSRRDTSGGDTTPKAPIHSHPDKERNPFESSLTSSTSSSSSGVRQTHSRKNSAASTSNTTTNARDYAAAPPPLSTPSLNASSASLSSNLSASTSSSSSHHGGHTHSAHHGLPAGLRTPTLQKSFVLPEVTSSVNATGLHAPNPSSKTAAAALHQSPMYPSAASSSSTSSSASGRNTPTRTAHQHTSTAPYPNPKEHASASPKSKQPDFKLSQPPDTKHSSPKSKDREKSLKNGGGGHTDGGAPTTPVNQTFPSSATPASSSTNNSSALVVNNNTTPAGSSADSSSTAHSSARKRENHGSSSLKGKLTVKIIEARNLVTPEANIRPYVVATFEQNEFVSREAINEHEEDARGEPVSPRTSSQLRLSQRGPRANGNGENGNHQEYDAMDISTSSAYHPVWKHEVAL